MTESSKQPTQVEDDRSLRDAILPKNFDKARTLPFEARKIHEDSWKEKINKALDKFISENPDAHPKIDPERRKNMDKVIGYMAKALTDVCEVLNIGAVDFEFFRDETDHNYHIWKPNTPRRITVARATDDSVGMHNTMFWNFVENVRSSPYAAITSVPQSVGNFMAEEVGHIYVARMWPEIHKATLEANSRSQKKGDHKAYDDDPGENALHQFADDYQEHIAGIREWPFK